MSAAAALAVPRTPWCRCCMSFLGECVICRKCELPEGRCQSLMKNILLDGGRTQIRMLRLIRGMQTVFERV